jgi:hypothetical protein
MLVCAGGCLCAGVCKEGGYEGAGVCKERRCELVCWLVKLSGV